MRIVTTNIPVNGVLVPEIEVTEMRSIAASSLPKRLLPVN